MQEIGERAEEAAALHNIGKVYYDLDEKPQAIAYSKQALAFKLPSAEAEAFFTTSYHQTLVDYRTLLRQTRHSQFTLANNDFDTGQPARVGEYKLADQTYARLIAKLAQNRKRQPVPGLREDILTFYGAAGSAIAAQIGKPVGAKSSGLLMLELGLNQ
jgi:tetratricopeptide (TPR) repeat protein